MNIKFTSNIRQNGEKFKISFESKVEISKYKQFIVYEFVDPKTNALNRIEVGDTEVNIFIGNSSMNLVLNEMISTVYNTLQGKLILQAFLSKLEKSDNKIEFAYTLRNKGIKLGKYRLKLEIGEI